MRVRDALIAAALILPVVMTAQAGKLYTYVDENGVTVITDKPPPEASDLPKDIVNEHGVTVGGVEGKKTEAELEAERIALEEERKLELQRRADRVLLATYVTIEEIQLHRDRRVELFQAQARVTELYLRNTQRRLNALERDARRFKPYNSDPNAPRIDDALVRDIEETRKTVERQQANLQKYRSSQEQVIASFDGDINRFKILKGIE